MPLFSNLLTPCLLTFSKVLKVEMKKVKKQIITTPVSISMSRFFIYFLSFRLKNINNPTVVGAHNPIKTAFSKFSCTMYIYSDVKIIIRTTNKINNSDFLNFVNIFFKF